MNASTALRARLAAPAAHNPVLPADPTRRNSRCGRRHTHLHCLGPCACGSACEHGSIFFHFLCIFSSIDWLRDCGRNKPAFSQILRDKHLPCQRSRALRHRGGGLPEATGCPALTCGPHPRRTADPMQRRTGTRATVALWDLEESCRSRRDRTRNTRGEYLPCVKHCRNARQHPRCSHCSTLSVSARGSWMQCSCLKHEQVVISVNGSMMDHN
jgi:hypothetical protein